MDMERERELSGGGGRGVELCGKRVRATNTSGHYSTLHAVIGAIHQGCDTINHNQGTRDNPGRVVQTWKQGNREIGK